VTPTGDFRCWGASGVSADVLQWPSSTQRGPHLNLENMGVQVELADDRVGSSRHESLIVLSYSRLAREI